MKQLIDERERLQALQKDELGATPSALVRESDPNDQQVQRRMIGFERSWPRPGRPCLKRSGG